MPGEQELAIYGLTFGSAGCLAMLTYPAASRLWGRIFGRMGSYQHAQATKAAKALDDVFVDVKPSWLLQTAYGVMPVALGVAAYVFFNNVLLVFVGVAVGAFIPEIFVRQARALRRRRFQGQLVDLLFHCR